ncbi:hypothetical protein [Methanocaldococcus sp.]
MLIKKIKEEVNRIREELGMEKVDVSIVKVEERGDTLIIYTKTRTDKSIIIGPGGWVVGKLREKLGYNLIKVEDYSDKILFLERVKEIKKSYDDKVIKYLANYFLENKIYKNIRVYSTITCQYDLYIANLLNEVFDLTAILLNPPILPSRKYKKAKEFLEDRDINYIDKKIEVNFKEFCGFLPNKLDVDGYIFTSCLKESYLKYKDRVFINFLKLFPLKFDRLNYLEFCPICIQNLNNNNFKFLIKNIVDSVYWGVREPTDAAEEIVKLSRVRK